MKDQTAAGVHWSFWAIGAVALAWNLISVVNFLGQMSAEMVASMPESHRAIIDGRPVWATGAVALAVFGGALGCVLLLLRKSAAYYLFLVSLLGVIVQMVHSLSVATSFDFPPFEFFMMILSPLLVGGFLVWYSKRSERRGLIS